MRHALFALGCVMLAACEGGLGGGSDWVKQPLPGDEKGPLGANDDALPKQGRAPSRTLGAGKSAMPNQDRDITGGGGKVLGTFRNTYYDFPHEADHSGPQVSLMSASCKPIASVPRTFYDALCVQGSGRLARGGTVSFAKRDCACAEVCPRTGQKICFEALDQAAFPWGRGAAGTPITPMRSVAADTSILPMGTVLYIPELEGDESDGCFVVEDRGSAVKGEHVDIFTGRQSETAAMNARVPSNQGVTVVVNAPKCSSLSTAH